ncbi:MAG: hypothetical protein ACFCUU_00430 [Cyclobacteriaceae bacterium]
MIDDEVGGMVEFDKSIKNLRSGGRRIKAWTQTFDMSMYLLIKQPLKKLLGAT